MGSHSTVNSKSTSEPPRMPIAFIKTVATTNASQEPVNQSSDAVVPQKPSSKDRELPVVPIISSLSDEYRPTIHRTVSSPTIDSPPMANIGHMPSNTGCNKHFDYRLSTAFPLGRGTGITNDIAQDYIDTDIPTDGSLMLSSISHSKASQRMLDSAFPTARRSASTIGSTPSIRRATRTRLDSSPDSPNSRSSLSIDLENKNQTEPFTTSPAAEYSQERQSASRVRSSMDLSGTQASNSSTRSSSRDRYGFRKKSTFVTQQQYDDWWKGYEGKVKRRKQKWVRLMKDSGLYTEGDDSPVRFPPRSDKLKRYIRKGIPAEWRGQAWFWYARGYEKLNSHPGLYDKLCKQTQNLHNSDTELIERDLHRTFPDNIYFREQPVVNGGPEGDTPLIKALRRLLTCFSVYQPKIGYCQSLNFLAGLLLLFMDEEKAFWMLVIITQRFLPGVHEINLEGVNIDQGVLMLCVRDSLPTMWDKIGVNFDGKHYENILTKLPPVTLCTAAWFMSGYIGVLPIESVLRVWDCFFFEDSKIFFRIALTILKLAEPMIEGMWDQMEIFQVVQNLPKQFIDPTSLMENCFKRRNGFGHISQEEITSLRQFVAERRRQGKMVALKRQELGQATTDEIPEISSTSNLPLYNDGKLKIDGHPYSPNDLLEYNRLKPGSKSLHVQLSRRMRSLKMRSRPKQQ